MQARYTLFYSVAYSGLSGIPNINSLAETVSGCQLLAIFTSWIVDCAVNVSFILIYREVAIVQCSAKFILQNPWKVSVKEVAF